MPYELTDEQRGRYRATSQRSQQRKLELTAGVVVDADDSDACRDRLDPNDLMPQQRLHALSALSLFSGGGGLDIGFERAGFGHKASYEILDICGQTLRANRPHWVVHAGAADGDVVQAGFSQFRGVDVVHGGPPVRGFPSREAVNPLGARISMAGGAWRIPGSACVEVLRPIRTPTASPRSSAPKQTKTYPR